MRDFFLPLTLTIAGTLFGGCTPAPELSQEMRPSPYQLEYKESKDPEVVAEFDGEPISRSQIFQASPAIEDLMQTRDELIGAILYAQCVEATKGGAKSNFILYMKKPKRPFGEILSFYGVTAEKSVSVDFKEATKEQQAKSDDIAECAGAPIKESQLNKDNLRLAQLKNQIHFEAIRRISEVAGRRALLKASQAKKVTLEEYIKKEVLNSREITLSDEEFKGFMRRKGIGDGDVDEPTKERLKQSAIEDKRNTLMNDYIADDLLKKPIIVFLPKPQFKLNSNLSLAPSFGPADAGFEIVLFSNFTCKECQQANKLVRTLYDDYYQEFRVTFYPNFSPSEAEARLLAEAAQCLLRQSADAHWKFFDNMLKDPGSDETHIYDLVSKSGADLAKFKTCFLGRELQSEVDKLLLFAASVGVQTAPIMLVDGQIVNNARDWSAASGLVRSKLHEQGADGIFRKIKRLFKRIF